MVSTGASHAAAFAASPPGDEGPRAEGPRRQAPVAVPPGAGPSALGCLTPQLQGPSSARALALLERHAFPRIARRGFAADGTRIAYTDEPGAYDRVALADLDTDGTPDVVQRVAEGLAQARSLLVDRLALAPPAALEVVLLELGASLSGYAVSGGAGVTIVLDGSPADGRAVRRAAIHQYAHAVALTAGPAMPRGWGEALAAWAVLVLEGEPDAATTALLGARLERLDAGLFTTDADLAAGNAAFLAFLDEAHGPAAVGLAVQELATAGASASALERAIVRATGRDLAATFRDFHLWSLLVGPRADRLHFSFAERLGRPRFASTAEGLPALSVHADPPVAPWGAAHVRLVPDAVDGGLSLRFEGEYGAAWEADLVLVDGEGVLRRLALDITAEGSGTSRVPLQGVVEAWLLVRNLGGEDGAAHGYSYAAHRERGYPVEIASFQAVDLGDGVDLSWDTASERDLVGFNVLRTTPGAASETVVNSVWIPALGEPDATTSYQFLDREARRDVTYVYRVQAITLDGLTSLSEPFVLRRP